MDSGWTSYQTWSDAIAEEFFSGKQRDAPVYLDLEPDILARIGSKVGCPHGAELQALDDAVIASLCLPPKSGRVFGPHVDAVGAWEQHGRHGPPPCVGLLAFFSSVAEEMSADQDYRATNYYGRMAQRLQVLDALTAKIARDFQHDTPTLWGALNRWLEDFEGRFGLPTASAFDYRRFVGVPISQALVRDADRKQLAGLFSYFSLQPGQRLSAYDMTVLIDEWIVAASPTLRRLWLTKKSGSVFRRLPARS